MNLHRHLLFILAITIAGIIATPRPASADFTAFWGSAKSPSSRPVRGASLGISLAMIGFEFEYSDTTSAPERSSPSLRSGMFNVLIQTPFSLSRLQFYGTLGGGFYQERLNSQNETGFGGNAGAGVKIGLLGPLRLRADYRVFRLGRSARQQSSQRIYFGVNVPF